MALAVPLIKNEYNLYRGRATTSKVLIPAVDKPNGRVYSRSVPAVFYQRPTKPGQSGAVKPTSKSAPSLKKRRATLSEIEAKRYDYLKKKTRPRCDTAPNLVKANAGGKLKKIQEASSSAEQSEEESAGNYRRRRKRSLSLGQYPMIKHQLEIIQECSEAEEAEEATRKISHALGVDVAEITRLQEEYKASEEAKSQQDKQSKLRKLFARLLLIGGKKKKHAVPEEPEEEEEDS